MSETAIVFFDGDCQLCNHSVKFIIQRDPLKKFSFAAQKSPIGLKILKKQNIDIESKDTIFLYKHGCIYEKSDAVLHILADLKTPLKLFYPFILIPSFIRNPLYSLIAKVRYSIFGKSQSCMLPSPEILDRFLDD